jgi:hypothetical protein
MSIGSRDGPLDTRALYVSGDAEVKDRVVNGALEHILEEPACREEFRGWKLNPELSLAFSKALEWGDQS